MLPKITAHSGADGFEDNSLDYVRYALASEADYLEVDVRRGADGKLMLGHDEADAALPALEEVFSLLAETPRMGINCDLKEAGLEEAVCALAEANGLRGRVLLTGTVDMRRWAGSPGLQEIAALWANIEELLPDFDKERLKDPACREQAAEEAVSRCRELGIHTVNSWYGLADEAFLARFRRAGIALSLWTVNEEADLRRYLRAGVKSITTRKLKLALALREEGKGNA